MGCGREFVKKKYKEVINMSKENTITELKKLPIRLSKPEKKKKMPIFNMKKETMSH